VNGKDVIDATRDTVRNAEAAGLKSIEPKALYALLDLLEDEVAESAVVSTELAQAKLESYKAELTKWVAETEHVNAWNLEGFRQVIALGQSALKSVMLINGGASVAILAFIGHLVSSEHSTLSILPFAEALRFFVIGVFMAAMANGATYLTQLAYDSDVEWQQFTGKILHVITVLVAIGSFVAFFFGANEAYHGFLGAAT
jgi:hypothetical protein